MPRGREHGRDGLFNAKKDLGALKPEFVLLTEGSEFDFKSCIYLRCIQCHVSLMTLDAPKVVLLVGGCAIW